MNFPIERVNSYLPAGHHPLKSYEGHNRMCNKKTLLVKVNNNVFIVWFVQCDFNLLLTVRKLVHQTSLIRIFFSNYRSFRYWLFFLIVICQFFFKNIVETLKMFLYKTCILYTLFVWYSTGFYSYRIIEKLLKNNVKPLYLNKLKYLQLLFEFSGGYSRRTTLAAKKVRDVLGLHFGSVSVQFGMTVGHQAHHCIVLLHQGLGRQVASFVFLLHNIFHTKAS